MKILVANDDGIHAAGIKALVNVLVQQKHEVYVVAPNAERSAMGHSLTLHKPLRMDRLPDDYFPGVKAAYTIDGTPTDCIKIALNKVCDFKPDLVVSGINHGPNMGADIIYSGTVSAAMEGAIYGIKSIAFSLHDMKNDYFEEDAQSVPEVMDYLLNAEFDWPESTLFNVNLPALRKIKKHRGIKFTRLASRMYTDDYDQRIDPRGRYYYWLSGDLMKTDQDEQSDIVQCTEGFITVTPINLDFADHKILDGLTENGKK